MGKKTHADQQGRENDKFIMFRKSLYKSPAWKSLDTVARCLYLLLVDCLQFGRDGTPSNNGEIYLAIEIACQDLHVGRKRVGKAFQRLQAVGLIKATRIATFDTAKSGRATEWTLCEYRTLKGHAGLEYRKWRSPQDDYPVADRRASWQKNAAKIRQVIQERDCDKVRWHSPGPTPTESTRNTESAAQSPGRTPSVPPEDSVASLNKGATESIPDTHLTSAMRATGDWSRGKARARSHVFLLDDAE